MSEKSTSQNPQEKEEPKHTDPTPQKEKRPLSPTEGKPPKKQKVEEKLQLAKPAPKNERAGSAEGQIVPLVSNFFPMNFSISNKYDEYHVDFEPRAQIPKVFGLIRNKAFFDKFGYVYVYDGTVLHVLSQGNPVLAADEIWKQKVKDFSGKEFTISIKYTKSLDAKDLSQQTLHLFGIIYRKAMRELKLQMINRNYFDPSQAKQVRKVDKLTVCPGYIGGIHLGEDGLFMNIDIKQKFIREETVLDAMKRLRKASDWKNAILREFRSMTVLTTYNKRPYRIIDVNFDETPNSKFSKGDKEVSYLDYYQSAYGVEIKDRNQPLLIATVKFKGQKSQRIRLIPELCLCTGVSKKELASARRDITLRPNERIDKVAQFLDKLNANKNVKDQFAKFGVQISNKPVTIDGIKLKTEEVQFGSKKVKNHSWQRDIGRGYPINKPEPLRYWTLIYTGYDRRAARKLIQDINKVSRGLGVQVSNPHEEEIRDFQGDSFTRVLNSLDPKTQIVVVMLPREDSATYSMVKSKCVEKGIVSQMVVAQKYANAKLSMTTNVLLQIQSKIGAELWSVNIPIQKVMIVGIEITHNQRKKRDSVGALVATLNNSFTKYFTKTLFVKGGKTVGDVLNPAMLGALNNYYKVNKALPGAIFIYRDGVSEGELTRVLNEEVDALRAACKKIPPAVAKNYDPKILYVSVNKRVNQKFFISTRDGLKNPEPGTLVNTKVTKNNTWEFYLMPTNVNQGCTNPVKYTVCYNSANLKAKNIEQLTYKLTHMYFNWTGTIKIPSPVMYAHKCAEFVGQRLHIKSPGHTTEIEKKNTYYYL